MVKPEIVKSKKKMDFRKLDSKECYRSSRSRGGGGGGGPVRFGEMSYYPKWEECVEEFQRQDSLHQLVPKETRLTDFWRIILGKRVTP
jgi:hypothetical protein